MFIMEFLKVDYCTESGLLPIVGVIHSVVNLIQLAVPIGLILFGTLDLAKAVISNKDEEMKKAQNLLIRRVIYAVAVFFVIFIVNLAMTMVSDNAEDTGAKNWTRCWNKTK